MSLIEDLSQRSGRPVERSPDVCEFALYSTPVSELHRRGIQIAGVIPVVLHRSDEGVQVLMGAHRETRHEPDGLIGLPRETIKWDEQTKEAEKIVETAWRCFNEELGIDVSEVSFTTNTPKQNILEIEQPLLGKYTAHAKVIVLWAPDTLWLPRQLTTTELHAASFIPVDNALNPPSHIPMREMTQDVLGALFDNGMLTYPSHPTVTNLRAPQKRYTADFRYLT